VVVPTTGCTGAAVDDLSLDADTTQITHEFTGHTHWIDVCIHEHVYFNCYMRHWTDSVFVRTLSCFIRELFIFIYKTSYDLSLSYL